MCVSFTFFVLNKIIIVPTAINAAGMSSIVRMPMTNTDPANAPATAVVMPSTNAFILTCSPYFLK